MLVVQVVRIVRSAHNPQEAATLLTNSAFVAGSLDNLTAVVVALRGYKPYAPPAKSVAEPFLSSLLCELRQRGIWETVRLNSRVPGGF